MDDLSCSWIVSLILWSCPSHQKLQILCNPLQNSKTILPRNWKYNLKLHIEIQKTKSKTKQESKNKPINNKRAVEDITMPYFKLCYRAIAIKTEWYWPKNRHIDQWNRTEDLGISPYIYSHVTSNKEAKNIQWKKRGHLQQLVLVNLDSCMLEKWK